MECFKIIGNFIPPIQLRYCILRNYFTIEMLKVEIGIGKTFYNFKIQIIPDICFLHDRTCVMSHRPTFCYLLFVVVFVIIVVFCEVLTS
jgi:hypothetical protein